MIIVNLTQQENGAYLNQECGLTHVPPGWAAVPDRFISTWRENAPFVNIECDESGCINSMVPGARPELVPQPQPTPQEDADSILIDHEYRLSLLELEGTSNAL